ncbi:protein FRA10AC1-like [Phyllobates terribilis]|uniref:protein FRA10AC1-like n=1 Tax=Phyllobates terribilis TaxID=111132 RepID=UPI003CCAFF34
MASFRSIKSEVYDREARKQQYQSYIRGLNAYDRHKKFVRDYVSYYGEGQPSVEKLPIKTDQDTLREGYRFIRTEEDDMDTSWEQRLVKRYYSKLFKEYCIADMSKYKSGKVGLRWRTEKEVRSGKGQFICGNKHCDEKDGLASYEVNFVYFEAGEDKQALVKLVACKRCAEKLHYRRRKEKEQLERKEKEEYNKKRERSMSDDYDTDNEYKLKDNKRRKDKRLSSDDGGKLKVNSIDKSLKNKRKGKEKKTSGDENEVKNDDETFDEYMEGMFL